MFRYCTILFVSLFFASQASGQSLEEKIIKWRPYGYDVVANAGDILPQLYSEQAFESLATAMVLVKKYSDEHPVEEFYLTTLLHIQQSTFALKEILDSVHFRLLIYPGTPVDNKYYKYDNWHFGYYEQWQAQLRELVWVWANDLLNNSRKLSFNETFVCHTLAGHYRRPVVALRAQKEKFPELYAKLLKSYKEERSSLMTVGSLMVGAWMPTGNLKVVGTHPVLGLLFGPRTKHNAFSLTFQIRFLSAANFYTIHREDSTYKTKKHTTYYIGLGYARYLVHSTHFEAGPVGGIGYDGLNATYTIGSANLNVGLRLNYFFNTRFSIGIMPKYNWVWYKNRGGSNLSGYPFSIDLLFGR